MQFVFNTDVLVDVALQRNNFSDTEALLKDISEKKYEGWICSWDIPEIVRIIENIVPETKEKGSLHHKACVLTHQIIAPLQALSIPGDDMIATLTATDNYPESIMLQAAKEMLPSPWIVTEKTMLTDGNVVSPKGIESLLSGEKAQDLHFVDLKAQQRHIFPALEKNIYHVLQHGKYILGPEVKELEENLSAYVGSKYAVSCGSGTDALLMILMAWDIGPGDAVITTPFTFIATAEVIALLGAIPVFSDIDPKTFNLDPTLLPRTIEDVRKKGLRPRIILPVDLFGLPADYDAINRIAKEENLFVLEDAAQSFGGVYHKRNAGILADAAATSFFPAKPLGCYGDGGAIFTDDQDLMERLLSIRVHGKGNHKYENVRIGLNARMDTLQAGIVLAKLDVFPEELEKRQKVASMYTKLLSSLPLISPYIPDGLKSAWAQYSLLSDQRDAFMKNLQQDGIPSVIYYPKPLHLQPAFAYLSYQIGDFPVSEKTSKNIFSLPMHPYLKESHIHRIVELLS